MSITVTSSSPTIAEISGLLTIPYFEWTFDNARDNNTYIIGDNITDDMVSITHAGGTVTGTVTAEDNWTGPFYYKLRFTPDDTIFISDTTYTVELTDYPDGVYGSSATSSAPIADDYLPAPYIYQFTTKVGTFGGDMASTNAGGLVTQSVYDTAILFESTYGRNIGSQGGVCNNSQFIIEPDGSLRALVFNGINGVVLKSSLDNGYTWSDRDNLQDWNSRLLDDDARFNVYHVGAFGDGSRIAIVKINDSTVDEVSNVDSYTLVGGFGSTQYHWGSYNDATQFNTWYGDSDFDPTTGGLELIASGYYASDADGSTLYSVYCNNSNEMIVLGCNYDAQYVVRENYTYDAEAITIGTLAVKSWKDKLHIIYVANGKTKYISYNKQSGTQYSITSYGTFNDSSVVSSNEVVEPTLAIDSLGTLCVHYSLEDGTDQHAISDDSGETWTSTQNAFPSGYSTNIASVTNANDASNDVLGLSSGFLISAVFEKDGDGDLFTKEVSESEWRRVNSVDGNVIGGTFFKFTNEMTPHINNKESIRMAYQVGDNNALNGLGTLKSTVYQERVTNLAFSEEFTGTSYASDYIDYYEEGYKDANTELYIDKIADLGMNYSFTKYDPIERATVNGKSAYEDGITTELEALIDPGSYGFPTVAKNNEDFEEYIARDTRKMFYKPNTFLDRIFVLNNAGTLKRTIWTVRIMGNDYEIAQIVPRWLDGNIMYYEANLYVMGPSNDPFSKVILPSES